MAIPAPFNDQQIADQITRGGNYWYGDNGDTTIYYSFSSSLGAWWGNTGEYALNATQQAWIETALDMLSELFDLTFVETGQPANTEAIPPVDMIQFVNDTYTGTYSSSYTYTSGPNVDGIAFNAVVLDQTWASNQAANLDYGSYGFMTMLHEILHSLGMEHPGDYDAGSGGLITYQNDAEFQQDTHRYTIMSYFSAENDGSGAVFYDFVNGEYVYPRTPMVYDILAMTSGSFDGNFAGYGFNSTTRNTNTTYGYNATAGINQAYNFATHGAPVLTIYDTGGTDTLDLSGDTIGMQRIVNYNGSGLPVSYTDVARTSTLIDLREGHYSSTHGMTYNIGVAFGTVIENAIGTQFDDMIFGNDADNEAIGGGGEDRLYGGDQADNLYGEQGNDTLNGDNGDDRLFGGTQEDDLFGGAGNDALYGEAGFDKLYGGDGEDRLYGGDQADNLYGEQGNDTLNGDNGDDRLFGGTQEDDLFGGAGNDALYGEAGFDKLYGGDGEDRLYGGDQADNLYGEQGNDTLNGDNGDDRLFGGTQEDDLFGGAGNDALYGQAGFDDLYGGTGEDSLYGGAQADHLHGDAGFDKLYGGAGDDTLTGGAQADTFIFSGTFGSDTITDFEATNDAEDIDLSGVASITDWTDLSTPANGHMYQSGADVVIDDLAGNTITLKNVYIGDLHAADFIF